MEMKPKESCKGVVHGAFYKRNTRDDTNKLLWGRSQSTIMEIFMYGRSNEGKITIAERPVDWGQKIN